MTRKMSAILTSLAVLALAASACAVSALMAPSFVELPVLMYHHLDQTGDNVVTISQKLFEEQLDYLGENGYTTVSFDEVIAYVNDKNVELPQKPVAIVFDDGYESNYLLAYPALKARGDKATICVIGSCVGKRTYKDTGAPMLPYLGWDEAREMEESGLVRIGSHTYDMHQYAPLENGTPRESVLPLPGESDAEFAGKVREDYTINNDMIYENLGHNVEIFAYPNGKYNATSEKVIRSMGAKITLTTRVGMNYIRKGKPESLFLLRRYSINQTTDLETLQSYLDGKIPNK